MKKYYNTQQHDASDCAAAVISTILLTYKREISLIKIKEIIGTDSFGTTVKGVVSGLTLLNFNVKAVKTETKHISRDLTFPVISHVKTNEGLDHFVVIHRISSQRIFYIADPTCEIIKRIPEADFDLMFTGVLILCIPNSEFESKKFSDKSMLDLFKLLILPQKKLILTAIFASLVLSFVGIISSLFSKVLMDEIIPFQLRNSLYVFLLIFGIVSLMQNMLSTFRQHVLFFLSRKIDIPLLLGYYNHILHLPYFFFGTRKIGDVLTRFQDAITIKSIFTSLSLSLILDISLSTITAVVLWQLNVSLFGILIVKLIINIILIYIFKKPYKQINYEQMEAGSALNSQIIESVKNIETIKALNDEQGQIDRLESRYIRTLTIGYKEGVLKNIQGFISRTIGSIINLIFMGVGALFIIDKRMSIGDLLVFQTLSQFFSEPVQNLVTLQITFQEAQIAMKRLSEIMSLDREDSSKEKLISSIHFDKPIEFKNVRFSYGSRPPIIENLNLKIPNGSKVAFVGESGSGKTTIARLLMKFIDYQEGRISISGWDIKDINHEYIRKITAYIPQNIELFSGTILENLKVGNPHVTYEEIVQACITTGASLFIDKLPNRYNTFIEEGGSNLSGGEKQRIAIARALFTTPELYIFDEATSYLDSLSERIIHDFIFNEIKDKTVIIISHRVSSIINCNQIYYLENGSIVEQGTHQELMQMNGRYRRMALLQLETTTKFRNDTNGSKNEKNIYI